MLRTVQRVQPWLAVIDVALPGNSARLAALVEDQGLSGVLLLGKRSPATEGFTILSWPVDPPVLTAVGEALCLEFSRKKKLRREAIHLQQKLAARRLIEQAKGMLMQKMSLPEEEAFRYLRRTSMEQSRPMEEVARRIISVKNKR